MGFTCKTARGVRFYHRWLVTALTIVGFPSFLVLFAISWSIGGDAVNGFADSDRYFVASHGELTEVSRTTWLLSWYQTVFTVVIFGSAVLLSGLLSILTKKFGAINDVD